MNVERAILLLIFGSGSVLLILVVRSGSSVNIVGKDILWSVQIGQVLNGLTGMKTYKLN